MKNKTALSLTRWLFPIACVAGVAALGWIGLGALDHNPLALTVTLVIAVFFGLGTLELQRFRRGSRALANAANSPPADAAAYDRWLDTLPSPLPNAVRLRVDHGGRSALPGPALAPTLTGLLVLLGMLGTFLGMVATLHGTGLALEQASELDALRDALAAPVKGLGLAFGTSVAGVATSAMLGLMTALARRERADAVQALDRLIATTLQPFSAAHRNALQQDETLRAMQRQADAIPAIVSTTLNTMVDDVVTPLLARLQSLTTALDQQQQAAQQRQADGEQRAQARQAEQEQRTQARWEAHEQQAQSRLIAHEQQAQARLAEGEARTHARLLENQAEFLARSEASHQALARAVEQALTQSLADSARQAHATLQPLLEATLAGLARDAGTLHTQLAETVQRQIDSISTRLNETSTTQAAHWQQALDEHRRQQQAHADHLQSALAQFTDTFDQRTSALVQTLGSTLTELQQGQQAGWAEQDAQRLAAWQASVAAMAAELRDAWTQASDHSAAQQQQVCTTLAETARAITDTTQAQARATVEEIGRLLQAAAEAPRAAAEVIGELRSRLTDAMARDNTMLEERQRLLDTLGTLLGAVNQASTEQRAAIDALVSTSSTLLQQAGERLATQADAHHAALTAAATQTNASAIEMASLGEAFGFAVQRFGESNDALLAQLQRIEAALSQSMTRSDEQLAYYVAQAREVIDLSLSSQKQIIEDLQTLARREAA